jgi:peptidoglycan/xylan/chitin deacetylase (PgdA/CDA1 family)
MYLMAGLLLLIILVLPLAILYLVYLPPPWLINVLSSRYPGILFHIPTAKPILALTIDDAPSGSNTAAILEVLRANDTHATFFVIGSYVEGREEVLRDLVLHGNELASHAMHDEPSWKLGTVELTEQLMETQQKLQSIYYSSPDPSNVSISARASPPQYFRPGSGFFNSSMLMLLDRLSYRLVLGSIYPHDAHISISLLNAWHILRGARPGGIIVCHDRLWTPEMLRHVLPELKRRGFRIGSLSEALSWAEVRVG